MKKNKNDSQSDKESFLKYLSGKEQKYQLILFLVFYFVLFCILILLYPYPAGISDSGSYVRAAAFNSIDTYRPFGYSRFLISVHKLSPSIHFLVFVQYLLNAVSTLFLIFSIKYFFPPKSRTVFYLYAFFAIFSPLVLYLSDSVLSDSLFASSTIVWLTTGLWLLFTRKKLDKILFYVVHLLLLFYLINIRYTGLVYLGVTLLLVFITWYRRNIYLTLTLLVIPVILAYGYYTSQKSKVFRLVHVDTFSGFSGWQMANNALNCVPYIKLDPSGIKDNKVREFAGIVMQYDTLLAVKIKPTAKFMWDNKMPLKAYCFSEAGKTSTPFIYQWNYLGENVYSKFGSYIIKKYPVAFARYYLLPNCRLILYPTQDQVVKRFRTDAIPPDLLKSWFGFSETEKVYCRSIVFERTFFIIPVLRLIIWILVLTAFLTCLFKRKEIQWQQHQEIAFWFILLFVAVYFAFSAYASPFELRYIVPVHAAQITLIYIIANCIYPLSKATNEL